MSLPEPRAIAKSVIRTIVIPVNLYEAGIRNRFSLMDFLVFSQLRRIASLEQIAVFAVINDNQGIDQSSISTCRLADVMNLGTGSRVEFDGVFGRMVHMDEIKKLAAAELEDIGEPFQAMLAFKPEPGLARTIKDKSTATTLSTADLVKNDLPYQLKTSGSNVFVVVGNGFNKYGGATRSQKESMTFVKDLLELCCGLTSPSEVARLPLFKTFLLSLT